jgi:hypothetical protein
MQTDNSSTDISSNNVARVRHRKKPSEVSSQLLNSNLKLVCQITLLLFFSFY